MRYLKALPFGVLSYVPYHHAIGFLAEAELPQFAKDVMRTYKRPGMVAVDLLMNAIPLFLLFLALSFIAFRWLLRPTVAAALTFSAGWTLVAAGVLVYGHHINNEDFSEYFAHFVKWPHALLTQGAPVIGVLVGAWVAAVARRGEQGKSAA